MSKLLTTVILTKNEEKNIEDVVKNAMQLSSEVLVIDSGSTDQTVALAEANGAHVVFRTWDNNFAAQRNFALEHVKTPWVLYLDADERLNDDLAKDILRVILQNKNEQYLIKRKSVAFGQEFNHGVLKPDFVPRMFKTDRVQWINKVHERPKCDDKKVVLKGYVRHYTYVDWHQYFSKFNQYTTIWAQNAHDNGKKASHFGACMHGIGGFIQMAILKKGLLDGKLGFTLCIYHFMYTYTKYIKLIDLNRNITR